MPSSHTWNRREFNITQNGYFTILKSAGWFSAVPLPGGFRYLVRKSKGSANPTENPAENPTAASVLASTSAPLLNSPARSGFPETTIRLQTIDSATSGRHLMRLALIVVAATGLAWVLLWCTAFA